MKCKLRSYRLQLAIDGKIHRKESTQLELIWDEDMYFPMKYLGPLQEDIKGIVKSVFQQLPIMLSPNANSFEKYGKFQMAEIQRKLNNAIPIWEKKYGLVNVRPTMLTTKQKKCGILYADPLFDRY